MRVISREGEGKRQKRQEEDWAGRVLRPKPVGPCASEGEEPSLGEESLGHDMGPAGALKGDAAGKTAPCQSPVWGRNGQALVRT